VSSFALTGEIAVTSSPSRVANAGRSLGVAVSLLAMSCGDGEAPAGAMMEQPVDVMPGAITFRSDVEPITRVEDAKPNVFIPPFVDCREPKAGETGQGPDGKVCTNVTLSGCTEPGKYYPDYGSCEVVRTQRPFWDEAPAGTTPSNDPRLSDPEYMKELGWVTEQVGACACTCCHDARTFDGRFGQWDISHSGIWIDTLSNGGLALFAGLADSSTLGAYPADENHGFDRFATGIPTTDTARMQKFLLAELERRGISRAEAEAVPPFGGPIYDQSVAEPTTCKPGEGVSSTNRARWLGGGARYVYVMESGSKNPGVPPNRDLPTGTIWRLDVLASADPVETGVPYGTTPAGTFQTFPESSAAPALVKGQTYKLYVLADVGVPRANCLFVYGEADAEPAPVEPTPSADAGASGEDAGPGEPEACDLPGADEQGFGATCSLDTDCTCAADYCALQPGSSQGYCTKTGCKEDASICAEGWGCTDLSIFAPGLPSICSRP
jgi:hypothetical protein